MLNIWKIKEYDSEHERRAASCLIQCLQAAFGSRRELYHLVISPRINGFEADALLVSEGGFAIIEIKCLEKKAHVVATENAWTQIVPGAGHREILMKGGNVHSSGPYDQVCRYRHALAEFLRDSTRGVLSLATPVDDYKPFIKCVVFLYSEQESSESDRNQVSEKRWFRMLRPKDVEVFAGTFAEQRHMFVEEELEDMIVKCLGFPLSCCSFQNKENKMKTDSKVEIEKTNQTIVNGSRGGEEMNLKINPLDVLFNAAEHRAALAQLSDTLFVGIDFGTSTTTVTVLRYDENRGKLKVEPLKIRQKYVNVDHAAIKSNLVPTVIAYPRNKSKLGKSSESDLVFGEGAKACLQQSNQYRTGHNVWKTFKMDVGVQTIYEHSFLTRARGTEAVIETSGDAAAVFFRFLKREIDREADELKKNKVKFAVTVPASFELNQRTGLIKALQEAGINLSDGALLDEPSAAFLGTLAYFIDSDEQERAEALCRNKYVMVFDFGAGTCDISILKLSEDQGRIDVMNAAISKFTALGGRNIDAFIAEKVLLQSLNNLPDPLREELKKDLLNALAPVAEELKISVCKTFARGNPFVKCKEKDTSFSGKTFEFSYRKTSNSKEVLKVSQKTPTLRGREFARIMNVFCSDVQEAEKKSIPSIFIPIEDALHKAKIQKTDVDSIIMVGGSAKNPFVREKIHQYFGARTEIVEPGDLCLLVSRGAALHSFYINGLNCNVIRPILSEPICIETANVEHVVLFPAGSSVPIAEQELRDELYIKEDVKDVTYSIPFYSGSKERRFGDALFDVPFAMAGDRVHLFITLCTDKTLKYRIQIGTESHSGTFELPITAEAVVKDDIHCFETLKKLQQDTLDNKGKPPLESLERTADALIYTNRPQRAIETLQQLRYEYPEANQSTYMNKVAQCYSDMHDEENEYKTRKEIYEISPSRNNLFQFLIISKRLRGAITDEMQQLLTEALSKWPNDSSFLREAIDYQLGKFRKDEARKLLKRYIEQNEPLMCRTRYELRDYQGLAARAEDHDLGKKISDIADEVERKYEEQMARERTHLASVSGQSYATPSYNPPRFSSNKTSDWNKASKPVLLLSVRKDTIN